MRSRSSRIDRQLWATNPSHARLRIPQLATGVVVTLMLTLLRPLAAQPPQPGGASVEGYAYTKDSNRLPVADATVTLITHAGQIKTGPNTTSESSRITRTGVDGFYHFGGVPDGMYTLRIEKAGYAESTFGPMNLAPKETKTVNLSLDTEKTAAISRAASQHDVAKPAKQAPEFFDEPHFTVAGVTQAANSGGHGSDTALRTTEALAKATATLNSESKENSSPAVGPSESSLEDAIARNPRNSTLHHELAEVEEKLGSPLTAVREYQRAAELDPTEANLFDWGRELLTHRALEPATEVFTKGNHLFPVSVRTLVALGVTWYARGFYEQAAGCLANASDLVPNNPMPYLFLGKMQSAEVSPLEGSTERLARFAALYPENALANYYYAVSLWKQPSAEGEAGAKKYAQVESLLQKAVHLDPNLGSAYLQLGIVYAQRGDFSQAIPAYQKAIEVTSPVSPEVGFNGADTDELLQAMHYRLGQAYSRIGDKAKAQEQLQAYADLTKKLKEDTEREHRQILEFVISLGKEVSASPPKN